MTEPVAAIHDLLADAVRQLSEAGAKDELLAELTERHLIFGLARPPVLKARGRVWRLGVLLLARDATVYATGSITRATSAANRRNYQSPAAEERRSYRNLAVRSGLPKGETVNFNAPAISLDASALHESTGPLFLGDDQPFVRWRHSLGSGVTMGLDHYLRDRVELLVDPPKGA